MSRRLAAQCDRALAALDALQGLVAKVGTPADQHLYVVALREITDLRKTLDHREPVEMIEHTGARSPRRAGRGSGDHMRVRIPSGAICTCADLQSGHHPGCPIQVARNELAAAEDECTCGHVRSQHDGAHGMCGDCASCPGFVPNLRMAPDGGPWPE